jgi:hypothetical protein
MADLCAIANVDVIALADADPGPVATADCPSNSLITFR